jgi:hypothetical protein
MLRTLPLLLLLGCTQPSPVASTEQDARVSPEQAQQAYGIIAGVDYLPFGYKADGCYARALYMSMELAAQRIPSSAQFLEGTLQPTPAITWRYHVAPMVQVTGEDHRTILDPSLATGPVSLDEWIRLNNPAADTVQFFVPGSVYVSSIDLGSPASYSAPMIERFDQLPPFHESDIQSACKTAFNYLGLENPERPEARTKLVDRTQTLLGALADAGKLPEYQPGDTVDCGN